MWPGRYVGIPFLDKGRDRAGIDCWGLAKLIYQEELSIILPTFDGYSDGSDPSQIEPLTTMGLADLWEEVDNPREFDGIVIRLAGHPVHIGVMINPGEFIHSLKGRDVAIDRVENMIWKKRIHGIYRMRTA